MWTMCQESVFSKESNEYNVLKLTLVNYIGTNRIIPSQAEMAPPSARPKIRKDERRFLRLYFRCWEMPYYGQLPGWRDDSPIYMLWNGKLVGGLYVCDRNEFDTNNDRWGQLHYFFMDPKFKGKGLHSLLFSEGVLRARSWNLEGLYINTDRLGLPEIYNRWGAVFIKKIPKISQPEHVNMCLYDRAVYSLKKLCFWKIE